ncbi:MAG: aldehyde dehydrogenase family protein [Hyphomicrobiaceae bacterium]|nr:aldehyde dehydrogenase family protein [Hyphomicrobiaceae bacterium]
MTRQYRHFIDNDWQIHGSADVIERHSPATGELTAKFALGDATDLNAAVAAARAAFDHGPWPRMTAQERAAVLFRLADLIEANLELLASIEIAEVGKPRRFVEADVRTAAAFTRHAASMAAQVHGEAYNNLVPQKTAMVLRQPVGVAGIIVPWNFPIEILAKKVPFALASGCTAVVKPSELTSGSALEFARLAAEAGLPKGVLNIVTGTGSAVGEAMTLHPDVNMISFTGSSAVGQRIIRNSAETIKRVTLELGGKSANIVFGDANLEDAVEGTLKAIFAFQGQCCVAGSRLLLQHDIADAFLARLLERTAELRIGDPDDARTDIGSMISVPHLQKVMGYVGRARTSNSARLIVGGDQLRPAENLTDNFILPTIFDDVTPGSELFAEEVFGPVLAVSRFETVDEAINLANSTTYGLANTAWTSDLHTAMAASHRLNSGLVWVNTTLDGAPQLPFGGIKASGFGRELGNAGFEDFTELKTVILNAGRFDSVFPGAA